MKSVLITIGDEILHGQTIDTNSAWIAGELNLIGVEVAEIMAVSDSSTHITEALNHARSKGDIILMTGGLGPTRDDKTKPTLAKYFSSAMVFHGDIYEDIKELFHRRGLALLEGNRLQAELPEKCTPIRNPNGTAPGMWFEDRGQVFVSMPGVPMEMKAMMTDFVLPRLKETFTLPLLDHRFVHTAGVGESKISDRLSGFEDVLPANVTLAYLPGHGFVKLRLTARGTDLAEIITTLDDLEQQLYSILGTWVFGSGRNLTLEEAIGELLVKHSLSIGTAESCTGGHIGHKLTTIPGSSRYFHGGIIAYSNEVKQGLLGVHLKTLKTHGAVSEEVVREMVQGCLKATGADIAVAVSGIAGPDGGTPEKPVGTVWVAWGMEGDVRTKMLQLTKKRLLNIELTAVYALNLVRLYLLERFETDSQKG